MCIRDRHHRERERASHPFQQGPRHHQQKRWQAGGYRLLTEWNARNRARCAHDVGKQRHQGVDDRRESSAEICLGQLAVP